MDQAGPHSEGMALSAGSSAVWTVEVSCTTPLQLTFSVQGSKVPLLPAAGYNTSTAIAANTMADAGTNFWLQSQVGAFEIGDSVESPVPGETAVITAVDNLGPSVLSLDRNISGWTSTQYRIVKRQSMTLEILWNGKTFIPSHADSAEVINCTIVTQIWKRSTRIMKPALRSGSGRLDPPGVRRCCPEVVEELLRAGATVNAQDQFGLTPLFYASGASSNPEIICLLLSAGACAKTRDAFGMSALDYLLENASLKYSPAYFSLKNSPT